MAQASRNARVRRERAGGASLGALAREFRLSKTRIVELLELSGGDPLRPLRTADLATASVLDLERERGRLADRFRADLERLLSIDDELSSRQVDRILGLMD